MNTFHILFASALLTLTVSAIAAAQENRPARRLEAVTWNPVEHRLTWTVVDGSLGEKGKFEGGKKTTFNSFAHCRVGIGHENMFRTAPLAPAIIPVQV